MSRHHATANGNIPFTAEEEAEWDAAEAEWLSKADDRAAVEHRRKRNNLLVETDWMSGTDVTMPNNWKTYRQALRDMTKTASPKLNEDGMFDSSSVTFPTKPS